MVAIRLGICDRTAAWPENQGPEYLADFAAGPVTSSHLFNPAFEDLYLSYRTLMVHLWFSELMYLTLMQLLWLYIFTGGSRRPQDVWV